MPQNENSTLFAVTNFLAKDASQTKQLSSSQFPSWQARAAALVKKGAASERESITSFEICLCNQLWQAWAAALVKGAVTKDLASN